MLSNLIKEIRLQGRKQVMTNSFSRAFFETLKDYLCTALAAFLAVWSIYGATFRTTPEVSFMLDDLSTVDAVLNIGWVLCFAVSTYQGLQPVEQY